MNHAAPHAAPRSIAPDTRELFCPLASAIHADVDAINAATVAWAAAIGLVDARTSARLEASKVGSLVSRAYPSGAREPLQLAADWTTFFCLLDDVIERLDGSASVARALGAIQSVLCHDAVADADKPLERAAAELGARLDRHASPEQRARFDARIGQLFAAFVVEAEARAGARPLSIAAYLPLREVTVGIYVEAALGEIVEGFALTTEARDAVEGAGLLRSASNLVGWANDVHTYEKELRDGEVNNLVAVLVEAESRELRDAVAQAIAMHDAEMGSFLARSADASAIPELSRYALMLRRWVRGHLDWALETGRYRP